jgi:hypothetical protein
MSVRQESALVEGYIDSGEVLLRLIESFNCLMAKEERRRESYSGPR